MCGAAKNIPVKKILFLFVFICAAVTHSFAQTSDEKAVAKAIETLRVAMIDADTVVLKQIVSDKLSYGHSSGVVQNKTAFIAALATGQSDFVTIDLTGQTMTVSGDVAIVRHILAATTNDGGHPGTTKLAVLLVWQKIHGKWILLARQAVRAQ